MGHVRGGRTRRSRLASCNDNYSITQIFTMESDLGFPFLPLGKNGKQIYTTGKKSVYGSITLNMGRLL